MHTYTHSFYISHPHNSYIHMCGIVAMKNDSEYFHPLSKNKNSQIYRVTNMRSVPFTSERVYTCMFARYIVQNTYGDMPISYMIVRGPTVIYIAFGIFKHIS